ncbi:helix-turn-helix domain-containing protein [Undibacterium sp. Ji42W]|uniref:helix-turn-helix domain-containing protein n=1 Tax=Undibacterium sp. Ji42W TaxID=3413039 RepID=UPI003BF1FE19
MKMVYYILSRYDKPRLRIEEVCECLGITVQAGYQLRSRGKFPIPMTGNPLQADFRDVAEYLESQRNIANSEFNKQITLEENSNDNTN